MAGVFGPTDADTWLSVEVAKGEVEMAKGEVEMAKGEVEEDINTSLFPTVDSGRFARSLALRASNWSSVTTSMYAHAGTAVSELI